MSDKFDTSQEVIVVKKTYQVPRIIVLPELDKAVYGADPNKLAETTGGGLWTAHS